MSLKFNSPSGSKRFSKERTPSNLEYLTRFWIGFILAVIGLGVGAREGWLYLQSSKATATVVEKACETRDSIDAGGRKYDVCTILLELEAESGQKIEYEPPTGSRWAGYEKGDRKTVYYVPSSNTESVRFLALENGLLPLLLFLGGGGTSLHSRAKIRQRKARDIHAFRRELKSQWASKKRLIRQQLRAYCRATWHSFIALLVTFAMMQMPFFSLGDAAKGGWTLSPGEAAFFSVLYFIMVSASAIFTLEVVEDKRVFKLLRVFQSFIKRMAFVFFCAIPILLLMNFVHWLLVLIPLCLFIIRTNKSWWWAFYDYCLGTFLVMMFSVSVSWDNLFLKGLGTSILIILLLGATVYISQRFGLANEEQPPSDAS